MSAKSDAASVSMDSVEIAFNNTTGVVHDFVSNITGLAIKTSADVRLGFDQPANSDDFLLESADRILILDRCNITKLYLLGNSGSGTVYLIGSRR